MTNILLTGSSRGIGAALRAQLEACGATVIGALLDTNGDSYVR